MQKLNIYRSFDIIPVWNYWKIVTKGELKYICVAEKYEYETLILSELQKIETEKAYSKLFSETQGLSLKLQQSYYNAWLAYFNFLKTGIISNVFSSFGKYRKILDELQTGFLFEGKTYETSLEIVNHLDKICKDNNIPSHEKSFLRLKIIDYRIIGGQKKTKPWDLIEESVQIKEVLSQSFDIHGISVSEYNQLRDLATKKIKHG